MAPIKKISISRKKKINKGKLNDKKNEKTDNTKKNDKTNNIYAKYYPSILKPNFSKKIATHKIFKKYKLTTNKKKLEELYKAFDTNKSALNESKKANTNIYILKPTQKFLRNFMSPYTPYRNLLIYHEMGVGKTCTAITIVESLKTIVKNSDTKIYVIRPDELERQIFNINVIKDKKPLYQCTGDTYLQNPEYSLLIDKCETGNDYSCEQLKSKVDKEVRKIYEFSGSQTWANKIQKEIDMKTKGIENDKDNEDKMRHIISNMFDNSVIIADEAHDLRSNNILDKIVPPILNIVLKYSSIKPYEKTLLNSIRLRDPELAKQPDLEGYYLRYILQTEVNSGRAKKLNSYTIMAPEIVGDGNFNEFDSGDLIPITLPYNRPHYDMGGKVYSEDQALASLLKPRVTYQDTHNNILKHSLLTKRGMHTTADLLNSSEDITYSGTEAKDLEDQISFDDYDFVRLKFYSYYKNETLQFRCTVSELSEQFTPTWESNKYIGNPFNSYTYSGIERTLTFKFKVFSLNLVEHINAWRRLNVLAGLVYPQGYKGDVNAVAPPLIAFSLGDMYNKRTCFIDSMTFTVDENAPWEIGMNKKLIGAEIAPTGLHTKGVIGYNMAVDKDLSGKNFILPTIIDVDITLKFVESKSSVYSATRENNHMMYDYVTPTGPPADKKP